MMFSKRWFLTFWLLFIGVVGFAVWSGTFLHKEFEDLEQATESLYRSDGFRPDQLLAHINDLHNRSSRYFSSKQLEDYDLAQREIKRLEKLLMQLEPEMGNTRMILEDIKESLESWRTRSNEKAEAPLEIREANNKRNFELEESSRELINRIHAERTSKLLKMEESLDRLSLKAIVGTTAILTGFIWQLGLFYQRRIQPLRLQVKEQELQMQAQEKLMSLALLASGVAHEIRSPLASMKARLFTLGNTISKTPSSEQDLSAISKEITRMEKIVESFLQLARPAEPELERVDTNKLIRDLVSEREHAFARDGVSIRIEDSPNPPVLADSDQLRQCISNLLQNARDELEDGGEILVSAKTTNLPLSNRARPALRIDISDTGRGIPLEQQKRLFDPFYTTKKSGTGLGLPLSQVLIGKQGGRIAFQSQEGEGSVFSIIIPIASAENKTI